MNLTADDWVSVFTILKDHSPEEEYPKAENLALEAMGPEYIVQFLEILDSIIRNDERDESIRKLCSVYLYRSLKASNEEHLRGLISVLDQQPVVLNIIDLCFQMLNLDVELLQNSGAATLAYIYSLFPDELSYILQSIPSILEDPSSSITYKCGLFLTFKEVFNIPYFHQHLVVPRGSRDPEKSPYVELYIAISKCAINVIGTEYSNSEDAMIPLRIMAASSLNTAIKSLSYLLVNGPEAADNILECLPNSFRVADLKLYQELYSICQSLFEKLYPSADSFINTIFTYGANGLNTNDPEFLNASLMFWREIALFEGERETKKALMISSEHNNEDIICHQFIESIVSKSDFPQQIISIMYSIDSSNTGVEDVNSKEPSMYATVTLESFFRAAPKATYDLIREQFEVLSEGTEWTQQHAALLLLYCLCTEFSKNPRVSTSDIISFINQCMSFVVAKMKDSNLRIRETALFVVSQIINFYPSILVDSKSPEDDIEQLIGQFEIEKDTHPTILLRYTTILYHLCGAFQPRYNSPILKYFDKIFDILQSVIDIAKNNFSQVNVSDKESHLQSLLSNSHEALNSLYLHSPAALSPRLKTIMSDTVSELLTVRSRFYGNDIRYVIQALLCSNLSTLYSRIKSILDDEERQYLISSLFTTLEDQSTCVYEEALISLSLIVSSIKDPQPDDLDRLIGFIYESMKSCHREVIQSCSYLIEKIFSAHHDALENSRNQLIAVLFEYIKDSNLERSTKPPLIKSLSQLFIIYQLNKDELFSYFEEFYDLLKNFRDYPIDINVENDIEFATSLYESLAIGFKAVALLFYCADDKVREREMLNDMSKLCENIFKVRAVSDETLSASLDMLYEYSNHCTRANNVPLNKGVNHKLIDLAKQRNSLQTKAKQTKQKLHNT